MSFKLKVTSCKFFPQLATFNLQLVTFDGSRYGVGASRHEFLFVCIEHSPEAFQCP